MSTETHTTADPQGEERTTHFGFKTVREEEKVDLVRGVFDNVASKYDLMNDLMSMGVHRAWKNRFIDRLRPHPGQKLLDVGGGTGDIAFKYLEKGGDDVTVFDINHEMLEVGRDRAIDRGLLRGIQWMQGNAEELPFEDATFDAYTIAFCIRNVTRIDKALAEARRVLKPGGQFLCLEFSKVVAPVLDTVYDTYSFEILPRIGQLVANDRESYQYLAESIRRFPDQETFKAMIETAGLDVVSYENLTGGISCIHSAWRT
ncbi:MAG: bifunctional demethylmenaquinone methyltransferase/2-methoxy-6-polyprenyl-1,4-benzoquinol methylase UbiE [Alphaproteobacteria bacterium]|nr:bifunctional demethylmenaquinone methyltransferase/2-methoxy-6-polyprenyl-1,4-benzoquinol methylase UbiE [Alphaproteobacteria bacterium]